MPIGRTVVAQLRDCIPRRAFETSGQHYHRQHRVNSLSYYDQFLCLAFAQLCRPPIANSPLVAFENCPPNR
jgi:hypothetical protein